MNYAQQQRNPAKHLAGATFVVLLHVVIIYALVNGLARKVVEVIKHPLETKIIEETRKPPPPPPELPPPPPKLVTPPPPFIPPPEIKIAQPPPVENTITAVTTVKPPEPFQPPVPRAEEPPKVEAPPAPPAPPPPPKPRLRVGVKPIFIPSADTFPYPPKALRDHVTGKVVVRLTVSPNGSVSDAKVIQAQPKRTFDSAAVAWVMQYKFEKGPDEFEIDQEISFNISD
jgi:protein TonB